MLLVKEQTERDKVCLEAAGEEKVEECGGESRNLECWHYER